MAGVVLLLLLVCLALYCLCPRRKAEDDVKAEPQPAAAPLAWERGHADGGRAD